MYAAVAFAAERSFALYKRILREKQKARGLLSLFCFTTLFHFFKAVFKIKKFCSLIILVTILFSAFVSFAAPNYDYDEEGAYRECCTLYPDFIDKVKNEGVSDKQLLNFVKSVENEIIKTGVLLTNENFDTLMFASFKSAFDKRGNIAVRDALAKAYPKSVTEAMSGNITDEFMPIYTTVKRFLFGDKSPVITISHNSEGIFVHSVNIPDDAKVILSVYSPTGVHILSRINPQSGIMGNFEKGSAVKVFVWDNSLSPLCDPAELFL